MRIIGYLGRRTLEDGTHELAYPRLGLFGTPAQCRKYAFGALYARTHVCEVVPVYIGDEPMRDDAP